MTKAVQSTPNALDDSALDAISGGPHFRTWDPPTYLAPAGDDKDGETRSSGHYTQIVWAKT